MRRSKAVLILLSFLALTLSHCAPDAPHDNPNDPASPKYNPDGVLAGKVLTLGAPYFGIPNALVVILQDSAAAITAADGSFEFRNAPTGIVTVVVTKQGYLSDTLQVALQMQKSVDTLVHLDALPQIINPQVITSKVDQWWPGPVYSAFVTADVNDPDGISDINPDSVFVQVDSLTFPLGYSLLNRNWQASIQATSLPNRDIQWLVSKQLLVIAYDREKGMGMSQPFYITRIIEPEPLPLLPNNSDTIHTAFPQFTWGSPGVSYDYTYVLQLYLITAGTPSQVGNSVTLNSGIQAYDFPDSLPNGQYFWTIALVDGFGNSSRSKEAPFAVIDSLAP